MLSMIADRIVSGASPERLAKLYRNTPERLGASLVAYRFKKTVVHAAKHSPFYRRAFAERHIDPYAIEKPADLGDFFTTPQDIVANAKDFLCRPPAIVFESSGTSGKNKQIYYDRQELARMGNVMAAGMGLIGLERGDRVANAFDFSIWIPGMLTHNSLIAAGNFCLAFGKVDPIEVYRRMEEYRFNVVMGEPTWLIRFTELAEKHGTFPVKLLVGAAEEMPAQAIPWMQSVWQGAQVKMCYGSVELGSALGFQPCDKIRGYHVDTVDFLPEIIEPDEEGFGELVFTTLSRWTMPLIRYRTRDVSRLHEGRCACGLPGPTMDRLRGRRDEMVVASGGNLYPLMFANILAQVPGVTADWQIIFRLDGVREVMEMHVEAEHDGHAALKAEIQNQATLQYPDFMKNLALGIFYLKIIFHPPGTLRTGRKIKRMVDMRHGDTPSTSSAETIMPMDGNGRAPELVGAGSNGRA